MVTNVENTTPPRVGGVQDHWRRLTAERPMLVVTTQTALALVVIMFGISLFSDVSLTAQNLRNIVNQASVFMILGAGMAIVMNTAGIDISVGSIVGVCTGVMGILVFEAGVPVYLALLATVAAGVLLGTFNAAMIVTLKVPAIIVTLGTLTAYRGLSFILVGPTVYFDYPQEVLWIARGTIWGIPVAAYIAAIVCSAAAYLLHQTRTGRFMTAIGGNEEAARLAGIKVNAYRGLAYVITGFCAGLAAVIVTARLNASQPNTGDGMELHTIAVVVVGGTSLFGARTTIVGVILGALMVQVLQNGLLLVGLSTFWQFVALGCLVIVAVGLRTYKNKTVGASF